MTLKTGRWEWNATTQMRHSYELFVKWLNRERGGVWVHGSWHSVDFLMIDDSGDEELARRATEHLVYDLGVNILAGPYSSHLGAVTADVANESGAVAVLPASIAGIYEDRPQVFGILPEANVTMRLALQALWGAGARTVAYFQEDSLFARATCGFLRGFALANNIPILGNVSTELQPDQTSVTDAALALKNMDPDLVVICAYDDPCSRLVAATRQISFSPKAMLTMESCIRRVRTESPYMAQYLLGYLPWFASLNTTSDMVSWTAEAFSRNMVTQYTPTTNGHYHEYVALYQAASAFAALEAIIVAIEAADSTEPADIAAQLREMEYRSIFGTLKFDDTGRNSGKGFMVQIQENVEQLELVASSDESLSTKSLVYPMPAWQERECRNPSEGEFSLHGFGETKPACLRDIISSANMLGAAAFGAHISADNEFQVVDSMRKLLQSMGAVSLSQATRCTASDASTCCGVDDNWDPGPTFFFDNVASVFSVRGNQLDLALQAAESFYLTQPGSQICSPCPQFTAGMMNAISGRRICSACPAGKHLIYKDLVSRTCYSDCNEGWARDRNGTCSPCPVGRYSTGDNCQDCERGKFNGQVGTCLHVHTIWVI